MTTHTPEQLREAEALAVKECAAMSAAYFPDPVTTCADRCKEKASGIADDCPFMAQAKMALFDWIDP